MDDMREEAMRIMREMDEERLLEWMRWVREAALKGEMRGSCYRDAIGML